MTKSLAGLLAPLASAEELGRLPLAAVEARTQDWAAALGLFVRLAGEEGRLAAAVFPARDQQLEVLARVGGAPLLLPGNHPGVVGYQWGAGAAEALGALQMLRRPGSRAPVEAGR